MTPQTIIKEILARRGWTQQKIAERVGVGQSAISKIARGQRSDVLSGTWERLKALHTEVAALPLESAEAGQHDAGGGSSDPGTPQGPETAGAGGPPAARDPAIGPVTQAA